MRGPLSALFISEHCSCLSVAVATQPKVKKKRGKNSKSPIKVIFIFARDNQNVENGCIFCYQLHRLTDWEFVNVYFLLAC